MTLETLMTEHWLIPIAGASGGLVWVMRGIMRGDYKNNKYMTKITVEMIGGMITGTFASLLFAGDVRTVAAFACGLTWSDVIQRIRSQTTKRIDDFINRWGGGPPPASPTLPKGKKLPRGSPAPPEKKPLPPAPPTPSTEQATTGVADPVGET
jgi:hypothetical protein